MSDQRWTGDVISLEEIFRSREFGRRPTRRQGSPVASVEPNDPPQLEQVFLSDLFGRPEAIATPATLGVTATNPSVTGPSLVLLSGRGDAERDFTRYRSAIGAVSGVAAAALVVAGMTSGTGSPSGQPTVSAEGRHPGHGSPSGGGGPLPGPGGVETQPNAPGTITGQPPGVTGGAAGGTRIARLASVTAPTTAAVVVEVPPPPPVEVAPSPPAPGGGTSPSGTSPGGGSLLTPVLVTVGTTVAGAGSTVTAASKDLAQAVPAASPVTGLVSGVGTTVTNLGRSVAGA